MHTYRRKRLALTVLLSSILIPPVVMVVAQGRARAWGTGVNVETASYYEACAALNESTIPNADPSGRSFMSEITRVNSAGFAITNHFWDQNTWNSDFLNPNTPNAPTGANGNTYADAPNLAISFLQGHGNMDPSGAQPCWEADMCTAPPQDTYISAPPTCAYSP
jgi:hypothetical protein